MGQGPPDPARRVRRRGRAPPSGACRARAAEVADLYARYEAREAASKRWLDFDDVLSRCADAIDRDDDFAAGQRWRFRHLFVDEFQDATPLQMRLLRAWLGDRSDLCVVGDRAQAIYGFTGADASPLIAFDRHFPGGHTIALGRNYRTTAAIVALAEAALGPASGVERDAPRRDPRRRHRAATVTAFDDDDAGSDGDRRRVLAESTGGVPWHHMAVLFRTNAQSSLFETAFTRRGVPFRVDEGQRFAARPAGARCSSTSSATPNAARPAARSRITSPTSRPTPTPTPTHAARTESGIDDSDDRHPVAAADATSCARTATRCSSSAATTLEAGGGGLGRRIRRRGSSTRPAATTARRRAGVDLVTFHRAKGLEWKVVFVTGLERGLVPISWATTPEARAEERRLLHVALGRAEDELHCSWARARTAHGRRSPRQPSPWLGELEAGDHAARPHRAGRPAGRASSDVARARSRRTVARREPHEPRPSARAASLA